MNLRRMLHRHRDPDWIECGVWRYFVCRCGAVRLSTATTNLYGMVAPGWPDPRDRHNRPLRDSGWLRIDPTPSKPTTPYPPIPLDWEPPSAALRTEEGQR